jgi:DNA-binding NarL/FixJ family response regulator
MEERARILLVDDHPIVREGLTQIIDQEEDLKVCGEAGDPMSAMDRISSTKPNLVIADISLKESDGIEMIKTIRAHHKKLPVLVFSMHDETLYAERSLLAGANGYIMKGEPNERILIAIRQVLGGTTFISEKMGHAEVPSWHAALNRDSNLPFFPEKRPLGSPFSD